MDLRPIVIPPSPEEAAAIDAALSLPADEGPITGVRTSEERRTLLLPALHAAQRRAGWLSPGALGHVARRLHLPPAEVFGVATFYGLFSLKERPHRVLHVCDDIACRARGAEALKQALERRFAGEGKTSGAALWLTSPCLGLCDSAPAALLTEAGPEPRETPIGDMDAERALAALERGTPPAPHARTARVSLPPARLLQRVGKADPTRLEDYRAHGGYAALHRAFELGPAGVIGEVTASKLVGRGGAAFPTGRKWAAVASQPARPHYLVCNADESEPGTFKDRVLMEEDPFALVEATTVAGFATGCEKGFLYVRGEYPLATERLTLAIEQARAARLLGDDVMGRGVRFDIELRRGAGAYICGEETALFNSIEGYRGEPRNKPPFPVEVGLFGKPTVINNVETLVSAMLAVQEGGAAYAARGTPGSSGTKLFCLSGHVQRPGVYEVELGTRLSELIAQAGGVAGGREVRTVLLGGAAGTFLTPDELDVPLTFEDTRRIGATLGSGVVLVLDDSVDLLGMLRRMAAFFRDESCGQCVPCRVGTVRVEELLARAARRAPLGSLDAERALLDELGQGMRDASICGLGQTATAAVESAVKKLGVLS